MHHTCTLLMQNRFMYFNRKPCTHTFLFVHQLCSDAHRLPREKLKLELTGTLSVFRIYHPGFLRPRTHANGYDHIGTNFMRICLVFTLFLPYLHNLLFSIQRMFLRLWKWKKVYPVNNSPGVDTCEQPILVGLEWIRINARPIRIKFAIGIISGYVWIK